MPARDDSRPDDASVGFIYGSERGNALERAYVAEGLNLDRAGDTMAAAVDRLAGLPLLFQPGARWYYGLSTDVLGLLVEVVSGHSLGDVFRDRIFAPLGMMDTAFAMTPAMETRLASLYTPAGPTGGLRRIDAPFGVDHRAPVTLESGGAASTRRSTTISVSPTCCWRAANARPDAFSGGKPST